MKNCIYIFFLTLYIVIHFYTDSSSQVLMVSVKYLYKAHSFCELIIHWNRNSVKSLLGTFLLQHEEKATVG